VRRQPPPGNKPQNIFRSGAIPEAARCACPGYRIADGSKPVAPVRRQPPPGNKPQNIFRSGAIPEAAR
ncbi:hypothetical protein AB2523_28790, partial [Klebsiella michiganensis]|uniref:hypothetical protein n=1 Tax=Klebsiella michiganensis TaxID=1134687 RepID=UPI001C70EB39